VAFVVMIVAPENKKPVGAADGFRVPCHGIPVVKANLALAAFVMRPQAEASNRRRSKDSVPARAGQTGRAAPDMRQRQAFFSAPAPAWPRVLVSPAAASIARERVSANRSRTM